MVYCSIKFDGEKLTLSFIVSIILYAISSYFVYSMDYRMNKKNTYVNCLKYNTNKYDKDEWDVTIYFKNNKTIVIQKLY